MRRRRSAFSLIEVLVCLAVMAILAGMLPLLQRGSTAKAGARGAAESLAQVLRAAQSRAVLKRTPVAFGLPTQNGSNPYAQSYYLLEGFTAPRVVEVTSTAGDFPLVYYSFPTWTSASPFTVDNSASLNGFNLTQWAPPAPTDSLLIFTPSGSILSNGLPLLGGAYHLVVGQGLLLQGTQLSGAAEAFTVSLTPLGQVNVETGVTGATALNPSALGSAPPAAPPPALAGDPSNPPTIANIILGPNQSCQTLPSGTQAVLQRDQYLTLTVRADSPECSPLFCSWECSGGNFSCVPQQPMQWDATLQKWVSTIQWQPGPTAPLGNYSCNCSVVDAWNNRAADVVDSQVTLNVTDRKPLMLALGHINGINELCTAYMDGTGQRVITENSAIKDYEASFSPDGTKIASIGNVSGVDALVIRNLQGGIVSNTSITGTTDHLTPPVWSPDGTKLAFVSNNQIWICNADGTGQTALTSGSADGFRAFTFGNPAYPSDDAVWSPDGQQILFHRWPTGFTPADSNNKLCVVNMAGAVTDLTGMGNWGRVTWDPAGGRVICDSDGSSALTLVNVSDGSSVALPGGALQNPHYSWDGQHILATQGLLGLCFELDNADLMAAPRQVLLTGVYNENRTFAPDWADANHLSYMRGLGGYGASVYSLNVSTDTPQAHSIVFVVGPLGGDNIHVLGWSVSPVTTP